MNPHFTLFRYAMTRPGDQERRGSGAWVAAFLIVAVVVAAVAIPLISG